MGLYTLEISVRCLQEYLRMRIAKGKCLPEWLAVGRYSVRGSSEVQNKQNKKQKQ